MQHSPCLSKAFRVLGDQSLVCQTSCTNESCASGTGRAVLVVREVLLDDPIGAVGVADQELMVLRRLTGDEQNTPGVTQCVGLARPASTPRRRSQSVSSQP
jgi:hypothetical protein